MTSQAICLQHLRVQDRPEGCSNAPQSARSRPNSRPPTNRTRRQPAISRAARSDRTQIAPKRSFERLGGTPRLDRALPGHRFHADLGQDRPEALEPAVSGRLPAAPRLDSLIPRLKPHHRNRPSLHYPRLRDGHPPRRRPRRPRRGRRTVERQRRWVTTRRKPPGGLQVPGPQRLRRQLVPEVEHRELPLELVQRLPRGDVELRPRRPARTLDRRALQRILAQDRLGP